MNGALVVASGDSSAQQLRTAAVVPPKAQEGALIRTQHRNPTRVAKEQKKQQNLFSGRERRPDERDEHPRIDRERPVSTRAHTRPPPGTLHHASQSSQIGHGFRQP